MEGVNLTEWPARLTKSGKTIMCGRKVGPDYVCTGLIARVVTDFGKGSGGRIPEPSRPVPRVALLPGEVQRWDGTVELTSHAKRRIADGRPPARRAPAPLAHVNLAAADYDIAWQGGIADLPLRKRCPHCPTIAVVTFETLGLPATTVMTRDFTARRH